MNKPKLAISACLLGHRVRYDGRHKYIPALEQKLRKHFELVAVCPESEAGLGVPRPPITLVGQQRSVHAVIVDNPETDLTQTLQTQAKNWLQQHPDIQVLIVKARSPSCAWQSFPLGEKQISGIFTHYLQQNCPDLIIFDEEQIQKAHNLSTLLQQLTRKHDYDKEH